MLNEDIHNIDFKKEVQILNLEGKIDIVCGGPPCQGFSTVGKKNLRTLGILYLVSF